MAARSAGITPAQFVEKWAKVELSDRAASHEHFIDLCQMLGQPTLAEADPTASLPANYLVPGRSVKVKAWGTYSNVTNVTLIFGAFIDAANNLGDGTSIVLASNFTNARWYFECIFTCLTTGTTNTVRTGGFLYFEGPGGTTLAVLGNTLNVNTANALTCESVAQFSVANAGNTLTSFGCEIAVVG